MALVNRVVAMQTCPNRRFDLVVFIPFLVLDMLVSAALMSMGMMMVPPVIVSLPFKLLLFVVVDGWALITTALVGSYG